MEKVQMDYAGHKMGTIGLVKQTNLKSPAGYPVYFSGIFKRARQDLNL